MSKKDYISIGNALIKAYNKSKTDEEVHYILLKDTIDELVVVFQRNNPSFSKAMFINFIEEGIQ